MFHPLRHRIGALLGISLSLLAVSARADGSKQWAFGPHFGITDRSLSVGDVATSQPRAAFGLTGGWQPVDPLSLDVVALYAPVAQLQVSGTGVSADELSVAAGASYVLHLEAARLFFGGKAQLDNSWVHTSSAGSAHEQRVDYGPVVGADWFASDGVSMGFRADAGLAHGLSVLALASTKLWF